MFKSVVIHRATFAFLLMLFGGVTTFGQSLAFTYQGQLTDGGNPADGLFDMRFRLFTTQGVGTGFQQGPAIILPTVQVTNSTFSVQLDFAPCATCFNGSPRFLEISIRPAGSTDPYTILSPRQPLTSTPYAVRSATAATADTALNAEQLEGQPASGFIQNTSEQQAATNFNIGGSGTVAGTLTGGVVNAATQYNLGGLRMLDATGPFNNGITILAASNTFLGESAGLSTTPDPTLSAFSGKYNSFFGADAGKANTTGLNNSFFGTVAGAANTTGINNSFFGSQVGRANTTGGNNSFFGTFAGDSNTTGLDNSFFGKEAGASNTTSSNNSFFGARAGDSNTTGGSNSFFGKDAGFGNTTGGSNSFFGLQAGDSNTTGIQNTIVGFNADLGANDLTNATAIGARARVDQSNSLVLGSISGVSNCTPANNCDSVNVGIGTTLPAQRLHVVGNGLFTGTLSGNAISAGTTSPLATLHLVKVTSDIASPVAIIESAGNQAPLAFRFGATEVARIRADSSGNLVLATLDGVSKNIFIRAGDDSTTDIFIQSSTGNVGIGDITPVDKLDVEGDIRVGTGTTGCVKDSNTNVIAGTCSSDARLKHSITAFPETLDKLIRLRPVHFYWRADEYKEKSFGQSQSFGLIAQEVERVMPELVAEDERGYKAVNYSKLPLLMLQAIKELKAENNSLKQRLDEMSREREQIKQQQIQIESLKKIICLTHPDAEICK